MDPIYVTGHQNPDTDSIVAAIAYASLRNALGDREYEAACLGRVSDETQIVLNHFGFQPPKMITNVYTQVKDLDYDMPPILSVLSLRIVLGIFCGSRKGSPPFLLSMKMVHSLVCCPAKM